MKPNFNTLAKLGLTLGAAGFAATANAGGLPVTGKPRPTLSQLDTIMINALTTNGVKGGVLGVMRNGVIVYQRGFGWWDSAETIEMRQDTPMRVASVTKPVTAAALQILAADGTINMGDNVFNLGQPGGGWLNYAAWPNLADNRYAQITIQDVISHDAGLPPNNVAPDPIFMEIAIADAFNNAGIPTSYPPGRVKTTQWIMGNRTLVANPGSGAYNYSNDGFMILGLLLEQATGQNYIDYVRANVFGPLDWCPTADVVYGRTFPNQRDPREPYYENSRTGPNVFDPDGDSVRLPDGGWQQEQHVSSGGLVMSTTALLHLAENYRLNGSTTYGQPNSPRVNRNHNGLLWGSESWVEQRTDAINYAIILNDGDTATPFVSGIIRGQLDALFNANTLTWPTDGIDGQWVDGNNGGTGNGSYEEPWQLFDLAVSASPWEATLNVKPSNVPYSGTVSQKMRLRAPEGTARIGTN